MTEFLFLVGFTLIPVVVITLVLAWQGLRNRRAEARSGHAWSSTEQARQEAADDSAQVIDKVRKASWMHLGA
ncbi:hypothetical protein [Homoserinimonas sp. A520]